MSGQDPFSHNGSAMVGMIGDGCVGIAADTRLGVGFQTVSVNTQKVFKMQDNILLGLTGLSTDITTLFFNKLQENAVQAEALPAQGR